jgi:flagellar protein FliO/FliZ
MQMALSLGLVLAAIFALAWVVRRTQGVSLRAGSNISVSASLQVGSKERVVLINAGGTHVLLGIAPGSVRTLHVYSEAPTLEERSAPPPFAEALKKAFGDKLRPT